MKVCFIALIPLVLALCAGCQDFFTYSPLGFLERDPETLSKEQQLLYAEQALSSGNEDAMGKALSVVIDQLVDDPNNVKLLLLAGNLWWTLSHAPVALQNYLFDNSNQFPAPGTYDVFVADIEGRLTQPNDIPYLRAAAAAYMAAEANGGTLHAVQQLVTGIGLISINIANLPVAAVYLDAAITALVP
jgi:hypothetical protein